MALFQNEAKVTEATNEAKAHCEVSIREAEAHCATLIREAEAHCTTLIREAEADCATIVVEVEVCCTTNIRKAVLLCGKCLFHPTIPCRRYATSRNGHHRRGGERPPLLPGCLWNGTSGLPPGGPWSTNEPPPTTHREHTSIHSSEHSPQVHSSREKSTPMVSPATPPVAPGPSSGTK